MDNPYTAAALEKLEEVAHDYMPHADLSELAGSTLEESKRHAESILARISAALEKQEAGQ